MQSWFKYAIAFFALVLVLTGFIYVLGPASTRQAFRSGETQTGQLLNSDQTLKSAGEGLAETESAGVTAPPATTDASSEVTPETASGTTEAAKPGTLQSTHGTDKAGNAKTPANGATATTGAMAPAAAGQPTAASPSPTATPKAKAH